MKIPDLVPQSHAITVSGKVYWVHFKQRCMVCKKYHVEEIMEERFFVCEECGGKPMGWRKPAEVNGGGSGMWQQETDESGGSSRWDMIVRAYEGD